MRFIPLNSDGDPAEAVDAPREILEGIRVACAALFKANGYVPPWIGYYCVDDGRCVGTCGYKSPPVAGPGIPGGRVEIAYFTFPEFEGRGYATAMARHLVQLAEQTRAGVRVFAQTLPEFNASARVLTKLGFTRTGEAVDHEVGRVWEWSLIRPADER